MQGQQFTGLLRSATLLTAGCSRSLMKLLIVEDHAGIRSKICELLARPSVEMRACVSGEDAMGIAPEFKPDWIIMDVNLPGVNGFEATEMIREDVPSARVVFISAEDRNYLREQAQTLHAAQFLCKNHLAQLPRMLYGESPHSPAE